MESYNPKIDFKFLQNIWGLRDHHETEKEIKKLFNGDILPHTLEEVMFYRGMQVLNYLKTITEFDEISIYNIYSMYLDAYSDNYKKDKIVQLIDIMNQKVFINEEEIRFYAVNIYRFVIQYNIFSEYNIEMGKILFNAFLLKNNRYPIILYNNLIKKINVLISDGISIDNLIEIFNSLFRRTEKFNVEHEVIPFTIIKEKVISIKEQLIEQFGIVELYVYGSYSRGEENKYSDLDVFVIFSESKKPFSESRNVIAKFLSSSIGIKVDVIANDHQLFFQVLPKDIYDDRVRVY